MTVVASTAHEPLRIELSRAEFGGGYLWVQYRVTPVPEAVRQRPRVCDLPCGEATLDGLQVRHCTATYRVGLDHLHIDGVLAIGPMTADVPGRLRARFAPLAGAPGWDADLCEVEVEVAGGSVLRAASRPIG